MRRSCLGCGSPIPHGSRCRTCKASKERRRGRPSAHSRGYGAEHQARLADMRRRSPLPCHWCHTLLHGSEITADHDPPIRLVGPHDNVVPCCRRCQNIRIPARDGAA